MWQGSLQHSLRSQLHFRSQIGKGGEGKEGIRTEVECRSYEGKGMGEKLCSLPFRFLDTSLSLQFNGHFPGGPGLEEEDFA